MSMLTGVTRYTAWSFQMARASRRDLPALVFLAVT